MKEDSLSLLLGEFKWLGSDYRIPKAEGSPNYDKGTASIIEISSEGALNYTS